MWYNNKTVIRTHCKSGTKMAWAIISGIGGQKRIKATSTDGVSNIFLILSEALANNRKVDVYINGAYVEQATLR